MYEALQGRLAAVSAVCAGHSFLRIVLCSLRKPKVVNTVPIPQIWTLALGKVDIPRPTSLGGPSPRPRPPPCSTWSDTGRATATYTRKPVRCRPWTCPTQPDRLLPVWPPHRFRSTWRPQRACVTPRRHRAKPKETSRLHSTRIKGGVMHPGAQKTEPRPAGAWPLPRDGRAVTEA